MRRCFNLIAALIFLVLLATTAFADAPAATRLYTDCNVEQDGACTVTLDVTIEFPSPTEDFCIPIAPSARNIRCTGAAFRISSEPDCKMIHLTEPLSGQKTITVSYRLAETVTGGGTTQEFKLNLLYPFWNCPISGYEVMIRLPGKFETMPAFFSGYHGDLIDNYLNISINDGTIHAVLNEKQTLQDREAMSVQLSLPDGFFDLRFLAGKTLRIDRLVFFALLLLSAAYWFFFLRNIPLLPRRQAMPPEGGNPGEIPFILTNQDPDFSMMVIHWAALGYLTIHRSRKGRLSLLRQIDMGNERKHYEGELFRTLFSRGDQCEVGSAEYLKAQRLAVEKARKFWAGKIYDLKAGPTGLLRALVVIAGGVLCLACFDVLVASKSWRWFMILPLTVLGGAVCRLVQNFGGVLLRRHFFRTGLIALLALGSLLFLGKSAGLTSLMLLNLAAQLLTGLLLRCGGRRTRSGFALGAELLGYRRYLLNASHDQLRANLQADPQFFYRVLPYADALQVGTLFANSFDHLRLEECDWLQWEGKELRTAPAFLARYRRLMAGLRGERDPGIRRRNNRAQAPVSTRVVRRDRRRSTDEHSRNRRTRPGDERRRP
ncbi:MAG: DUF2207 domain-containing protein [Oscillospiraceae bacterium]|nr:DUF2207 domain-containing protein [Oscillospiraceae bacterium]